MANYIAVGLDKPVAKPIEWALVIGTEEFL